MTPDSIANSGTEFSEQCALFAWTNMAKLHGFAVANNPDAYKSSAVAGNAKDGSRPIPELALFHAIKNAGHGDMVRGARSKAEGVKPGIPDTSLPVPNGTYHGLYIELKKKKGGRLSDDQVEMIALLKAQGYAVAVCNGWEVAARVIYDYYIGTFAND